MKKQNDLMILSLTCILASGPAFGWWDTVVKNWKYPPLVKAYEAEKLAGVAKKDIVADPLSRGGKAVEMTENGASLQFTKSLSPSTYVVYVVARSPRKKDMKDPGGMKPFFYRFKITELKTKTTESYRLRAAFQYTYPMVYGAQETARCYFIAPWAGDYRIEVSADKGSTAESLWVDALELRDVLGNCSGTQGKTSRNLTSDDELRNLRGKKDLTVSLPPATEIAKTCKKYWESFPPLNAPRQSSMRAKDFREEDTLPSADAMKAWKSNPIDQAWKLINEKEGLTYSMDDWQAGKPITKPFIDDGWGKTFEGIHYGWDPADGEGVGGTFSLIAPLFYQRVKDLFYRMDRSATKFEKTGDEEIAMEAAAILLAFAHTYPALDLRAQRLWSGSYGRFYFTNQIGSGFLTAGQQDGWNVRIIIRVYDQLFDFIKDNQPLADFLGSKVPGIKTPEDVIHYLDRQCVQRVADTVFRLDVNGRTIKATMAVVMAALCQGATPTSQAWIDRLFMDNPLGEAEMGGLEDMIYSRLGRDGLASEGSGGYSKGKIMAIVELAEMLKKYLAIGGHLPIDLLDFKKYPWLADAFRSPIDLRVAGGWVPLIGDYGHPLRLRETYFDGTKASKPFYLNAWRLTGDPAFAFMTYRYGRNVESPEEWKQIEAAAKTVRNPLNTTKPRIMDDFGIAVMETGQETDDYTKKKAVVLRYGAGQIHGHNDGLSFSVFGKGTRAISDLAARQGSPNPRLQKMHNTIVVDDESMCNEGLTVPGWGWLNAFVPMGSVQYVNASYRALSHPQIKTYRRGVALIDIDEDDAYVISVARAAGGKTYTFCAHANENDRFTSNASLKPVTSKEDKTYLAGFKPYAIDGEEPKMKDLLPDAMTGRAPDPLTATWRLTAEAEKVFLKKELPEDQKIHARWQLFGHKGDTVYAANATSKKYHYDMSFLYARRSKANPAGEIYPAIAEVYQGKPVLQSTRSLKIDNPGQGADACVGLEVKLPGNVTDTCLSGMGGDTVHVIEGGIQFDGTFAFLRRDGKGVKTAVLVGGTELKAPGVSLSLPKAFNEGAVTAVEEKDDSVTVKGDFKGVIFPGKVVQLITPAGRAWSYTVVSSDPISGGVRLKLKERLKIFQARISHLDEEKGQLYTLGEPCMLKADQSWYDDTLMLNEAKTRQYSARVLCDDRWVIVKTPVSEQDIPDLNGDGKRTLKLTGNAKDKGKEGKTLLEMDVTRVDEKTGTIYFKMPPEAPYNRGGWEYVNRKIVSESGRTWMATYPGYDYKIAVDGHVKLSDFTDANGDGRAVLSLLRVAPGARMRMPNSISMHRNAKGERVVVSSME